MAHCHFLRNHKNVRFNEDVCVESENDSIWLFKENPPFDQTEVTTRIATHTDKQIHTGLDIIYDNCCAPCSCQIKLLLQKLFGAPNNLGVHLSTPHHPLLKPLVNSSDLDSLNIID